MLPKGSYPVIYLSILVAVLSGLALPASAFTVGEQVEIDQVGLVHDDLRMGFWHWSHASGDPDPNDAFQGINDYDDSVGDHDCNFSEMPYTAWDPIAEDFGASEWPFTFPAGSTTEFVMTAPAPGQYVMAFQALVHLSNNCRLEYKANGQWVPLNTFGADANQPEEWYQTALFAFVVETDPGQTQIPIRVINPDYKLAISGVILAEFRGDPFAGRPTSGYTHGNMLFDKTQASSLLATFQADPFLSQRYDYCVGRAAVNNPSQYDVVPERYNVTGYREELLLNSVLSAINGDASMRNMAIELLMKPTNWIEWRKFGPLYHAGTLRVMATGYDHLYDYMTPAQRDTVRRRLDKEAMWMYVQSLTQAWWSPDGRANNWQAVTHTGLGFAGLVLKDESLRAPQYLDWAKYQNKLYVKTTLSASGSCREAYGSYYTYGLGNANAFFAVLKNVTGEDLMDYDNGVMQKTVPYSIYMLDPLMDGFCSFDDASHQSTTPATVMASMVKYKQDPLAQWMVQNYMGEYSSKSSYPGWRAWEQLFPLLWHDGNVPMEDPDTSPRTPLAKAFIEDGPAGEGRWGSGHVIMRTGFTSPDDIWFVLQSGDSGGYHGHVDQGSFILNAYGGHLVTDRNRDDWSREYASHSLVLIDDVSQVNDHRWGNGRMTRDGTVDDFYHDVNIGDYALANSKIAYDAGPHPVDRSLRHVMFIRKPNRQGYFVIADDVQSSTPGNHNYSWLLQSANWHSVALSNDGTFRINESGDRYYRYNDYQGRQAELQVMFATPQNPTMKVVTHEFDDPTKSKIIPYVEATQNAERGLFVTLLFPESDRLGIYTPTVTRIDDGNLAGFELGGDLVLFNKAGGVWVHDDIQSDARMIYLDRSNPGEISYLVAGATTLHVDGEEIFSAPTATTASGTIVDTEPPTLLAWYSAKTHDRGVGEVLLEIADDDDDFSDPRSGGIGKLVLEFSEVMDVATFTSSTMRVVGYDANHLPVDLSGTTITCQASGDGSQCEITFVPALPDYARYAMDIAGVTDLGGNPLAGDSDRIFSALEGDIFQDLRVNVLDLSPVRSQRTSLISPSDEAQVRADVTCDGRVNVTDLSRVRVNRGRNLQTIGNPNPNVGSFEEADGEVTIEAEEVDDNVPAGSHAWQQVVSPGDFDGVGAMAALPDNGTRINSRYEDSSPELTYSVQFDTPGTWYVWVRGYGTVGGNTVHVGLSGLAVETSDRIGPFAAGEWTWTNATLDMDGNAPIPATFEIDSPGVYPVNVWMREDGFIIDKLILHHGPGTPAEVQAVP